MPEYVCLKDAWGEVVHCRSPQAARRFFRCDDCAFFPRECRGLGEPSRRALTHEDRVRLALRNLSEVRPFYANSRLRRVVEKYHDEIKAARAAGHSLKTIENVLRTHGISISQGSLYRYFERQTIDEGDGMNDRVSGEYGV